MRFRSQRSSFRALLERGYGVCRLVGKTSLEGIFGRARVLREKYDNGARSPCTKYDLYEYHEPEMNAFGVSIYHHLGFLQLGLGVAHAC